MSGFSFTGFAPPAGESGADLRKAIAVLESAVAPLQENVALLATAEGASAPRDAIEKVNANLTKALEALR